MAQTDVTGLPDLQILGVNVSSTITEGGGDVVAEVALHNNGNVAATPAIVGFYLSSDSTWDPTDLWGGSTLLLAPLNPDETFSFTAAFSPWPVSAGNYFLIAVADPSHDLMESNTDNNTFAIPITIESALSEPKSTLPVRIGGTAIITHSFLWSYDSNGITYGDPADIVYAVRGPEHGSLLRNGVAATSFTQADIDNGLIAYTHNGDGSKADGFTFTVSDPAGSYLTEDFKIAIVDTLGPVVHTNGTLPVSVGGAALLEGQLGTVALGNDPAQMHYTVIASPEHGKLYNKGIAATTFTQADIDDHFIQYNENGDAVSNDTFTFVVSDSAGNVTAPQIFHIDVSDAHPNSAALSDHPWAVEVWRNGTLQDGLVLPGATVEAIVHQFNQTMASSRIASATSDQNMVIYEVGTFDPTGNTPSAADAHSMAFAFQDGSRISIVGSGRDFSFLVA